MSEVYVIMNLEKYSEHIRKKAAFSYSENYKENLDDFITTKQICGLISEFSLGKDEDGKYLISDEAYEKLFEAVKLRLYNCGLSKLAVAGHLDCAWDDKKNEMVFWSPGTEKLQS